MPHRIDMSAHPPIRLKERGPGASGSIIYYGVASADRLLPYGDILEEVLPTARHDTAVGLRGVPVVSPEDHQRWLENPAHRLTPLGTVLEAALEDDTVPFDMAIHSPEYQRRILLPDDHPDALPAVSVGYGYEQGTPEHPDANTAQARRFVNHLALVKRGNDSQAFIRRADAAGGSMAFSLDELVKFLDSVPEDNEAAKAIISAKAAKMGGGTEEPPKVEPMADADPAMAKELEAVRADALAQKARADAATAKLEAIDQAARTARYTALKVRADGLDLKPEAIEKPTDAQIAALALQIAEHGLRADSADPYARPDAPPPDRLQNPNAVKAPTLPIGAFGGGRS